MNLRAKSSAILAAVLVAVIVIAVLVMHLLSNSGDSADKIIKRAPIERLTAEMIEDRTPSACLSECFYSTIEDKKVQGTFKYFDDYEDYKLWENKRRDIEQTFPANSESSMAKKWFSDGYNALVISSMELFDVSAQTVVTCRYIDDENNALIVLGNISRNSKYEYSVDLNTECRQMYTVVFLKPEDVENYNSLTFAVDLDGVIASTLN